MRLVEKQYYIFARN